MHMKIRRDPQNRDFQLSNFERRFMSIPLMIHHYTRNRLPIKGAEHMCLKTPVREQLLQEDLPTTVRRKRFLFLNIFPQEFNLRTSLTSPFASPQMTTGYPGLQESKRVTKKLTTLRIFDSIDIACSNFKAINCSQTTLSAAQARLAKFILKKKLKIAIDETA